MTRQPKTARGEAIVDAAREMADAAERAATAYEQGCVLTRSGAEDEAATARAEIDRLIADFEDALSAAEARARKAEAERDEWRACAKHGATLVAYSREVADEHWHSSSLVEIRDWADAVGAIDPAAGTSDHELEPGRNDVNG